MWAPRNSFLIFDEVQKAWESKAGGADKYPDAVKALQTHRHRGIDFYLISQNVMLFDKGVRSMIGQHIHLVATAVGRKEYEWPFCVEGDIATKLSTAKSYRPYTLPKHIYSLYKSAEIHTKLDLRKPLSLYFLIFFLAFSGFFVYSSKDRITGKVSHVDDKAQEAVSALAQSAVALKSSDFLPVEAGDFSTVPAIKVKDQYGREIKINGCVLSTKKNDSYCKCFDASKKAVDRGLEFCTNWIQNRILGSYSYESVISVGAVEQD